ncbi:MAG TPA: hypothetical protein VK046_15425 [Actinomycetaceae bacterium]|nr:hypothetical protein [Actinomycetaceae bacterium]
MSWVIPTQIMAAGSEGSDGGFVGLLFFFSGFVFYGLMFLRYRNTDKRHMHARETEAKLANVQATDDYVGKRTRQSNKRIKGANERQIEGAQATGLAASVLGNTPVHSVRDVISRFT